MLVQMLHIFYLTGEQHVEGFLSPGVASIPSEMQEARFSSEMQVHARLLRICSCGLSMPTTTIVQEAFLSGRRSALRTSEVIFEIVLPNLDSRSPQK